MDISEDCVRRRAYRIWEAEGRPPGKYGEHWRRARNEIVEEIRRAAEHRGDVDHRLPLHVEEALAFVHVGETLVLHATPRPAESAASIFEEADHAPHR